MINQFNKFKIGKTKMARVTVEDCILNVPNRFELVLLSARRAREILAGSPLTVLRDNDKNPVIALREISENSIDIPGLRETLIRSLQRHVFVENHEEELDEEINESDVSTQEWIEEETFSDDESDSNSDTESNNDMESDDDSEEDDNIEDEDEIDTQN